MHERQLRRAESDDLRLRARTPGSGCLGPDRPCRVAYLYAETPLGARTVAEPVEVLPDHARRLGVGLLNGREPAALVLAFGAADEQGVVTSDLWCVRTDEPGVEFEGELGGGRLALAFVVGEVLFESLGDARRAIANRAGSDAGIDGQQAREHVCGDLVREMRGEASAEQVVLARRARQPRRRGDRAAETTAVARTPGIDATEERVDRARAVVLEALAVPARRADPPALTVTTKLRSGDELLHGREQLLRLIEAQPDLVGALDAVRALQGS